MRPSVYYGDLSRFHLAVHSRFSRLFPHQGTIAYPSLVSTIARNAADIAIPMRIEADPRTCAAVKIQDEFELGLGEWF